MLNQFSRTELLLGKEAMEVLANSRVAVFGIGGVGGYVVEALVRSGVGKYKVDVMKERILEINPDAVVNTHKCFFLPETKDEFDFGQYSYVVDAVDTVTAKIQLVLEAENAGVPIISSMGAGNKLEAAGFQVADIYQTSVCPLAGTSFCAINTSPHSEQCFPSVRPASVQVAGLAASTTSV